ncbi:MAG TPA: hypothetical protein VL133_12635 [Devosia sp.]|nr:hypothetical protein [Devosia sp.]
MHKIILSLAALSLSAGVAFAQTPTSFANVDTDGNGELSFTELRLAWPDLNQNEFAAADVNASGGLSSTELVSLQPVGAIEAPAVHMQAPVDLGPAQTLSDASSEAGDIPD